MKASLIWRAQDSGGHVDKLFGWSKKVVHARKMIMDQGKRDHAVTAFFNFGRHATECPADKYMNACCVCGYTAILRFIMGIDQSLSMPSPQASETLSPSVTSQPQVREARQSVVCPQESTSSGEAPGAKVSE